MPDCPIKGNVKSTSFVEAMGLQAFALFKQKKMAIFFVFSMLLGMCLPGCTILKNPRMFVMVPTMSGDVRAGFQPVCLFSENVKKRISIRNEQIMATVKSDEIGKELINGYNSHITGIKIATASETAALNSSGSDLII